MPNESPISAAARRFNSQFGQQPQPSAYDSQPMPAMGGGFPISFATDPAGQRAMLDVRDKIRQGLQNDAREKAFRQTFSSPAFDPYSLSGGDDNGLGNSIYSSEMPDPSQMAAAATAFNARTPSFVPPDQRAQEALNQQQYAGFDHRMADQDAAFKAKVDAFNAANAVGAVGRAGARPDTQQMASAGLLAGVDYGSGDPRWRQGDGLELRGVHGMAGYRPAPIGTPSPSRAAQMAAEQMGMQAADPTTVEQLRTIVPQLMNQAGVTPAGAQMQTDKPLRSQPWFAQQVQAEKLRDSLPPDQRAAVGVPATIKGGYTGAETGFAGVGTLPREVQQKIAIFNKQNSDPRYLAMMSRRDKHADEVRIARTSRAQDERDLMNGMDPSFRKAQEMLTGGGAQVAGAGGGVPGAQQVGMTPAQLNALAFIHGPELAAAAMKFNAEAANQAAANAIAGGQLALQQQVVQQQADNTRVAGDAQHTNDHAGALQLVASRGGWNKMTPDEKRRAVLKSLKSSGGWVTTAEDKGLFGDLGTTTEEAIAALGGVLPPYKSGWLPSSNEVEERRRGQLNGTDRLTNPGTPKPLTRPPRQSGGLGA